MDRLREEVVPEPDGSKFTPATPLVYHLCGTLQAQPTLVMTEDDYFTWLREWIKQVDNGEGIPGHVKTPLTRYSQLFLGYRFDDWEFRMVFQAIKSFQRNVQDGSPHVGVQLKPETLRVEREAAQSYLESYFSEEKISVYWQTSTDFLTELERTESDERPDRRGVTSPCATPSSGLAPFARASCSSAARPRRRACSTSCCRVA